MSSPKERLKEAKELFDLGIMDEAEFESIKQACFIEMGLRTTQPPTPSTSANPLGGSNTTRMGTSPPPPTAPRHCAR